MEVQGFVRRNRTLRGNHSNYGWGIAILDLSRIERQLCDL
jgi:hypothetical protein